MAELTPLERFQVAVEVAANYYYDFFYAQDCWEVGFICPCMNEKYGEAVGDDEPENCDGYWFIDLHTSIPFKSWDDKLCVAIAGDFTKWKYFDDCTCGEDDEEEEEEFYKWDPNLSDEENEDASEKFDDDYTEKLSAQEKFQNEVDKEFEKELKKAEKTKDKLGYYPIKVGDDEKGIPEAEVKGYKAI